MCQHETITLDIIKLYILEDFHDIIEQSPSEISQQDASSSYSASTPTAEGRKRKSLRDYCNDLRKKHSHSEPDNSGLSFSDSREIKIRNEISIYANLPELEDEDSPLTWWKNNAINFPLMSKLARKYLAIPASSVESERMFSTAGDIYNPRRSRLLPKNAEMLLFLHHNLRTKFENEVATTVIDA